MAIKSSTGLRASLMVTGSLKSILDGGFIDIYSGSAPADADAAATGTRLCRISVSSGVTGLTFAATAPGGVASKTLAETWSGVNSATGTAAYYRHVAVGDTAVLSTTQARLQGSVGTVGADLNLSSVSLVSGAPQPIDFYSVTLPAS